MPLLATVTLSISNQFLIPVGWSGAPTAWCRQGRVRQGGLRQRRRPGVSGSAAHTRLVAPPTYSKNSEAHGSGKGFGGFEGKGGFGAKGGSPYDRGPALPDAGPPMYGGGGGGGKGGKGGNGFGGAPPHQLAAPGGEYGGYAPPDYEEGAAPANRPLSAHYYVPREPQPTFK